MGILGGMDQVRPGPERDAWLAYLDSLGPSDHRPSFVEWQQIGSPGPGGQQAAPSPPPGWYPDPSGESGTRWWNGSEWAEPPAPPPPRRSAPKPPPPTSAYSTAPKPPRGVSPEAAELQRQNDESSPGRTLLKVGGIAAGVLVVFAILGAIVGDPNDENSDDAAPATTAAPVTTAPTGSVEEEETSTDAQCDGIAAGMHSELEGAAEAAAIEDTFTAAERWAFAAVLYDDAYNAGCDWAEERTGETWQYPAVGGMEDLGKITLYATETSGFTGPVPTAIDLIDSFAGEGNCFALQQEFDSWVNLAADIAQEPDFRLRAALYGLYVAEAQIQVGCV